MLGHCLTICGSIPCTYYAMDYDMEHSNRLAEYIKQMSKKLILHAKTFMNSNIPCHSPRNLGYQVM